MRRVLGLVGIVASAVLVGAMVANRHTAVLYLDPFRDPERSVEVPVYAALLTALALGVVLGSVATRLSLRQSGPRSHDKGAGLGSHRLLGRPR